MVVFSFFIFDRHYATPSPAQPLSRPVTASSAATNTTSAAEKPPAGNKLSMAEQAKLVFGVIFSLRNMVKKLCGPYVARWPLISVGASAKGLVELLSLRYRG
ncbi:hypothetical protein ABW21_db0206298 [Orbilia brochopaga]|nr:hypothetical protein ABW21_db0206298 [Drechslerella brochopaga]